MIGYNIKEMTYIVLIILITPPCHAQSPAQISYQAIVRNQNNQIMANQQISLRISIHEQAIEGNTVYTETHEGETNQNGLISIAIGNGKQVMGTFEQISWENFQHYLETAIDLEGGDNYNITSTSMIQSIPYALFANKADTLTGYISQSQIIDFAPYPSVDTPSLQKVLTIGNDANKIQIKNLAQPSDSLDAATKQYVDSLLKSDEHVINAQKHNIRGDGITNDTQAIIDLIALADGRPIFFPEGEYIINADKLSTSSVNIKGIMPQYIDGKLQNGTIFRGKLSFTGTNISINSIGVDLTGGLPDDGLRVTPDINTGEYCNIHHVITVGADDVTAFHSFLIEGFEQINISDIEVRNAYMGIVIKNNGGQLSNIRAFDISKEALFLKSDNIFGNCKDLLINGVYVKNNSAQLSTGIKIQSAGAQLENLNLSNIFIRRTQIGISIISAGSNGVAVNNINISNVKIDWSTLFAIYLEANQGYIYGVNLSNVDITNTANLMTSVGMVKYLNLNNLNCNIKSGLSSILKSKIIDIGASTEHINLANITVLNRYQEDDELGLLYANDSTENQIINVNIEKNSTSP